MTMRALTFALAAAAMTVTAGVAFAQRDPAYAAARSAGQVGEKPDGYLGVVGAGNPTLQRMVDDINMRRRAAYTEQARAAGSTVEQMAFTTGCNLIARTQSGEKYQAPDGSWQTRGSGAPTRDSRCI